MTKKITQPLGTKKLFNLMGLKKYHRTSWDKKITQPLGTKTIRQPLGTKKNHTTSWDKKSPNLSRQKRNHSTSQHIKTTQSLGTKKNYPLDQKNHLSVTIKSPNLSGQKKSLKPFGIFQHKLDLKIRRSSPFLKNITKILFFVDNHPPKKNLDSPRPKFFVDSNNKKK